MIEYANQNNATANANYIVLDAQNFGDYLKKWQNKFNKIYSCAALHWCPNQGSVLKNIYACLKPGGIIILGIDLQSALVNKTCRFGDTVGTWLKEHSKWGSFFTVSLSWIMPT